MKGVFIPVLMCVLAVALCTWAVRDQIRTDRETKIILSTEEKVAALFANQSTAEYVVGDKHWIIAKGEKETDKEFIDRCERIVFGGEDLGGYCWESDCAQVDPPFGPYHIKLCSPTQAGLDALVAAWCENHDCEECP